MAKSVLVGMSGGVDSSVTAWLLQQQGYECIGATMKLYDNDTVGRRGYTCCALDDVEDAKAVARRLGIRQNNRDTSQFYFRPRRPSTSLLKPASPCTPCTRTAISSEVPSIVIFTFSPPINRPCLPDG